MPCYRPIRAYRRESGEIKFSEAPRDVESLELGCGRCVGCRLTRVSSWANRCTHESELFERNCMVNLDYSDDHLPEHGSLKYRDVQRFLKRLRKSERGFEASPNGKYPIRFFMVGEYGFKSWRPHYHMLLFNYDFRDKYAWGRSVSGDDTYRSAKLEELWPYGHSVLGIVTPASAAYVAGYCLKKVMGRAASDEFYSWTDEATGEVCSVRPEFCVMSRRPGVGAWWYDKYKSDVLPCDYVVRDGRKSKVPRFYQQRYMEAEPMSFEDVLVRRERRFKDEVPVSERTDVRRMVAEEVALARFNSSHAERMG